MGRGFWKVVAIWHSGVEQWREHEIHAGGEKGYSSLDKSEREKCGNFCLFSGLSVFEQEKEHGSRCHWFDDGMKNHWKIVGFKFKAEWW